MAKDRNIGQKSKYWAKIATSVKNRNITQKSKY